MKPWLPLLLALFALAGSARVHAFELEIHQQVTRNALQGGTDLAAEALDEIVVANWDSDAHQVSPHRHFDNADGPGAICVRWLTGINAWLDEVVSFVEPADDEKRTLKDRKQALERIGWVTHSTQDFYSHTNYVELGLPPPPRGFMLASCSPSALDPRLQSGYFDAARALDKPFSGCPANLQLPFGPPVPDPPAPFRFCHWQLNKDNPDRPGHATAAAYATLATRNAWEEVHRRILAKYESDKTIDAECLFTKLAWGKGRSCHRMWMIEATARQTWRDPVGVGLPAGEVILEGLKIRLEWEPTRYEGPTKDVSAPVQIELEIDGPLRAALTWPPGCRFQIPRTLGETLGGELKVDPEATPIKPNLQNGDNISFNTENTVTTTCPNPLHNFPFLLDPYCVMDASFVFYLAPGPWGRDFTCDDRSHRYRMTGTMVLDGPAH